MVASNEDDDAAAQYEAAVNQSCNELFRFIRMELFGNPQVMTMTNLTSRLVASMNSLGIVQVKESTTKHLRRKLESEFAGALHIFPDAKGKLLLYPDDLSMRELAKQNQSLINELQALKSVGAQDVIAKAAIKLRADIKSQDVPQVWPPEVKPEAECATIPESLIVFLYYLLTGSNDPDHASQRVQRLVQSFGHDIVYNELTIRQQSGSAVCRQTQWCQALPSMDGQTMVASWPFTGCAPYPHQMWSWSC